MTKFFKKSKKPYFGAILGPFCPNFGKNEFSWKRALSIFKYFNYLPLCKNSEKTKEPFLRKNLNCWTDRQTRVILQDPPQGGGPIIKLTLSFPEFISIHQKPAYSINFFVRYNQIQSCAIRVGQLFMTNAHPNIFRSTLNFNEFVSTCEKSGFFYLLLRYI